MIEKEKGATPFESAPQGNTSASNSTAPAVAWLIAAVLVVLLGEVTK
ncbi:MAG TPA: hypothetical protein GX403_19255 [Rhodocyclaceae bacterium]|nr:hypothetical protein [Rhodocyclaceae bacterium]